MFKSIRWRLQIWYAVVLLTVIASFGGVLYWQARRSRLRQIDEQLLAAVDYLDASLRSFPPHELEGPRPPAPPPDRRAQAREFDDNDMPPPRRGPPPMHRTREQLFAELDLRGALAAEDSDHMDRAFLLIWRQDGNLLKSSDHAVERRFPDSSIAGIGPIRPHCEQWGTDRVALSMGPRATRILVGKPMTRELAELHQFAWQLAGTGGFALAIGLIGGWFLSARILRPLAVISSTASSISANNLARRLDATNIDRELAELATVLNAMFSRLEDSFARQIRFTADASHELRTPLTVLQAHVELALTKPRSELEYRETLKSCLQASGRMHSLVDGLLTLARADSGHLGLVRKPVDLRRIVEEVVDLYLPEAAKAGITLASEVGNRAVMVTGDDALLTRVAENLLANALRHTPSGGQVRLRADVEDNRAMLSVADNGSGIPPEDQARIFERFFRVDVARSRATGGSGLGLAICKSLIEAHGGTIQFTSTPGEGTTFVVQLPLTQG